MPTHTGLQSGGTLHPSGTSRLAGSCSCAPSQVCWDLRLVFSPQPTQFNNAFALKDGRVMAWRPHVSMTMKPSVQRNRHNGTPAAHRRVAQLASDHAGRHNGLRVTMLKIRWLGSTELVGRAKSSRLLATDNHSRPPLRCRKSWCRSSSPSSAPRRQNQLGPHPSMVDRHILPEGLGPGPPRDLFQAIGRFHPCSTKLEEVLSAPLCAPPATLGARLAAVDSQLRPVGAIDDLRHLRPSHR